MRFFIITFILLCNHAFAQDSLRYDTLIRSNKGDVTNVKYKSVVTGGKHYASLKTGKWSYYDREDYLVKIENFLAVKSKKTYYLHGPQVYLNPNTGDTILIRNYVKGQLKNQVAFQSAVIVEKTKILSIYKDFNSFSIQESKNLKNSPNEADFVTLWKSSFEDPNMEELANYATFEDSLGDPKLLANPSFGTKTRYNYIGNPEFETHPIATTSIISFNNEIPYWVQASESPDFYINNSLAHSGNSFIGFRVFSMEKHIEYVQNKLKAPLKKDSLYCFSAYVRLSPGSKYATNAFGIQVSKYKNTINTDELLSVKATIALDNQVLIYKTKWMKVQCWFKAKGGEEWLTIGSFQNHQDLELVEVPGITRETYFYLDDVVLSPVTNGEDCPCNFTDSREINSEDQSVDTLTDIFTQLNIGESIILENIHFENDKSELLPSSFRTLNLVLKALNDNPEMAIELSGHTSSLGAEDHNIALSKRRADAVANFLTLNGIEESRITTKGYGPKYLIASDDSEAGQLLNRRVEFKVISL